MSTYSAKLSQTLESLLEKLLEHRKDSCDGSTNIKYLVNWAFGTLLIFTPVHTWPLMAESRHGYGTVDFIKYPSPLCSGIKYWSRKQNVPIFKALLYID